MLVAQDSQAAEETALKTTEYEDKIKSLENTIRELTAKNMDLECLLQKCKEQEVVQTIILPTPTIEKGETCNPKYICKAMNAEDDDDTPDLDSFMSGNNDYIDFDFSDSEFENITTQGVVQKITDFVQNYENKKPFVYKKGSWYVKLKTGWTQSAKPINKGIDPKHDNYHHHILVKRFVFIFRKRYIAYFNSKFGNDISCWPEKACLVYSLIIGDVLDEGNYRNSNLFTPMQQHCTSNYI